MEVLADWKEACTRGTIETGQGNWFQRSLMRGLLLKMWGHRTVHSEEVRKAFWKYRAPWEINNTVSQLEREEAISRASSRGRSADNMQVWDDKVNGSKDSGSERTDMADGIAESLLVSDDFLSGNMTTKPKSIALEGRTTHAELLNIFAWRRLSFRYSRHAMVDLLPLIIKEKQRAGRKDWGQRVVRVLTYIPRYGCVGEERTKYCELVFNRSEYDTTSQNYEGRRGISQENEWKMFSQRLNSRVISKVYFYWYRPVVMVVKGKLFQ